jgi:hypothetical protein
MKDEINKSINDFSKGNKDLAKILALFASAMISIVGKTLIINLNKELMSSAEALKNYYDVNI